MIKTFINVTLQVEGIHCWPAAKELLPEVAFLSDPHRHIFWVSVVKKVYHEDRDVEIIMFKRELQDYFKRNYFDANLQMCDFKSMSCEMIAKDLVEAYNLASCKVLEDNENGATVIQTKD